MLGAIRGSAQSMDRAAQSMDPYFAQESMDRAGIHGMMDRAGICGSSWAIHEFCVSYNTVGADIHGRIGNLY